MELLVESKIFGLVGGVMIVVLKSYGKAQRSRIRLRLELGLFGRCLDS